MFYINEMSYDSNVISNWCKTFFQSAYSDNALYICKNSNITPIVEISIIEFDVEQALSSLKNIIHSESDAIVPIV